MRLLLVFISLLHASHAHADTPKRVVSVGGALTEIIYALDGQDALVGSDTTSYFPPQAEQLPKVGYQRALSAEGILSLAPDVVIVTEEAGPPAVLEQLKAAGASLLQLKAGRSLDDVKANIRAIGTLLERMPAAQQKVEEIDKQYTELQAAITQKPITKKVLFILQHGGGAPMVAGKGTAADSIIALSGATNAVAEYEGYKPLTPEAAAALNPDILLITKQGLEQAGGQDIFLKAPGIALTKAAKEGRLIAMDSLLLLGFGPRTIEAAKTLRSHYEHAD